jgi:putative transposase
MSEKTLKDTPEFSWLNECISYALQQKRMDFDEAKKQFFNKNRKKKSGRMKFKKKGVSKDSFRIPGQSVGYSQGINFETSRVRCPKIGMIKVVVDREFTGKALSYTFSKNKCGQYFVSILVECEPELKQNTGRSIGIDLGLNTLCVLSDGTQIENPRLFRKTQTKLKKAQQHLSRKQKGSARYEKQRIKVAKIHQKIANQRNWINHNISTWLVDNFDTIIMEDLNVAGMKKMFGKSISDASFSSLINMIGYKSNWYGKTFHKISRWFASSKICNCCGHKMDKDQMTLDVRFWTCPSCGSKNNRDLNAAHNILDEGLRDLYQFTSEELSDYKRREVVRPAEVSPPKASSMKRLVSFIEIDKNNIIIASEDHINKALDDSWADIRHFAAHHPNASKANITKALNDFGTLGHYTRMSAAYHPNATPEHIDKALDDINYHVRTAAAKNQNASVENLRKALRDVDPAVTVAAYRNPKAKEYGLV